VCVQDLAHLLLLHAPWKCADWLNSQTSSQHSGELTVSQTVAKVLRKSRTAGKRHVVGKIAVEIIAEAQRSVNGDFRVETPTDKAPIDERELDKRGHDDDIEACQSSSQVSLQEWSDGEPSDMDMSLSESDDESDVSFVGVPSDEARDVSMWMLTHDWTGEKTPSVSTLVRQQRRQQSELLAIQRLIDTSVVRENSAGSLESPVRTVEFRRSEDCSTSHSELLSTQDDVVKRLLFTASQAAVPSEPTTCQCSDWLGFTDSKLLREGIQSAQRAPALAFHIVTQKVHASLHSGEPVKCLSCVGSSVPIRCEADESPHPTASLHSYFVPSHREVCIIAALEDRSLRCVQQLIVVLPGIRDSLGLTFGGVCTQVNSCCWLCHLPWCFPSPIR
jgi:hypothetical protein